LLERNTIAAFGFINGMFVKKFDAELFKIIFGKALKTFGIRN